MTYITNSMTSANPAADLYTAMASALSTAGYTLVDTVVISTRTHKVWKSPAAGNSLGLDWYLDVAYTTTGAGSVWLGAFEYYDPATDLGYRGPYAATSTNPPDATYFSRFGATGSALETTWTHISDNVAQIQTQTTAYAYWMSITTDRVIAMSSVAPTAVKYCGFFDMYTPWANKISTDAFPLVTTSVLFANSVNSAAHSNATTGTTINRIPPVQNIIDWRFAAIGAGWSEYGGGAGTVGAIFGGGIGGPIGYVDSATVSFSDARRGGALDVLGNGATGQNNLFVLGTLKDLQVFFGQSVTRGDTISISSTDWVLSNLTANRCYGFKAI